MSRLDRISTVRLTQKYLLFLIPHHSRSCREIANSESPSDPWLPPNLSEPLYFLTGNSSVFIINFSMEVFSFHRVKFHPISLITVFKVSNQQNEWTLQKSWLLCSIRALMGLCKLRSVYLSATAVQFCAMCSGMAQHEQGSWTRWSHFGPFQPDPFCDYVILPDCSVSWTNAISIPFFFDLLKVLKKKSPGL